VPALWPPLPPVPPLPSDTVVPPSSAGTLPEETMPNDGPPAPPPPPPPGPPLPPRPPFATIPRQREERAAFVQGARSTRGARFADTAGPALTARGTVAARAGAELASIQRYLTVPTEERDGRPAALRTGTTLPTASAETASAADRLTTKVGLDGSHTGGAAPTALSRITGPSCARRSRRVAGLTEDAERCRRCGVVATCACRAIATVVAVATQGVRGKTAVVVAGPTRPAAGGSIRIRRRGRQ
jgi:hypothetical protein